MKTYADAGVVFHDDGGITISQEFFLGKSSGDDNPGNSASQEEAQEKIVVYCTKCGSRMWEEDNFCAFCSLQE